MEPLLKDKIAVVTGGARGIGYAIAEEFVNEGADVVLLDIAFPEDFDDKANLLRNKGRKVIAKIVDITNTAATQQALEEIEKEFGKIDILVNNAGITRDRLLVRMTEEDWDAVLNVNLKGCFNTIRTVSRVMAKQRSGKIINVSSVVGLIGNFGQANYSSSKAGIIGFTKTLAKELGKDKITVNAVAPGFIETDMTHQMPAKILEMMISRTPLKRLGKPEEIANAFLFLASDEASFITGSTLSVDGGTVVGT